eukprot:14784375-Alexandrium_andersonii.AAC.1
MSASLVGSEMCIRDSLPEQRGPSPGQAAPAVVKGLAPPPLPPARERASAVSYTHLTLPTICSV